MDFVNQILPTHISAMHSQIAVAKLDPITDFEDDEDGLRFTITHKISRHKFVMERDAEDLNLYTGFFTTFTVKKIQQDFRKKPCNIGEVFVELQDWITNVVKKFNKEYKTQNPWKKYKQTYDASKSDNENSPFTPEQSEKLKAKLLDLPQYILSRLDQIDKNTEAIKNLMIEDVKRLNARIDLKEDKATIKTILFGQLVEWVFEHGMDKINIEEIIISVIQFLEIIPNPPMLN